MLEGIQPRFINYFPGEIILRILHFCDSRAILRFAATCKKSLNIVTNSISLQLHLELEANGLEIIEGSCNRKLAYSTILADLRRYRDAWLELDLNPPVVHRVDQPEMIQWELRDGAYIKAHSASADDELSDSLEIIPLNSPSIPSSVYFHCRFQDFSVDLSQQLAVLVGVHPEHSTWAQLHLRSITTGLSHPLVQNPLLTVKLDFDVQSSWTCSFDFKIMGTLLLTKFALTLSHRYEVLIWNWVEGVLLHRISCTSGVCDFAFLDREHLVLSSLAYSEELKRLHSIALLVFNISAPSSNHHVRVPPDGHINISAYSSLGHILKLEFPRVLGSLSASPFRFMLRSDPIPGRVIYTSSATFSCTRSITLGMLISLFEPDQTNRMLGGIEPSLNFCVFISGDHLHEHLNRHKVGDANPTTLLWHEWGENATRWFTDADELDEWTCWISGSRYVNGLFEIRHRAQMVSVFDFNTLRIRRHSGHWSKICSPPSRREEEKQEHRDTVMSGGGLVTPRQCRVGTGHLLGNPLPENTSVAEIVESDIETTIRSGFEEPVVSRLPYRIVTKAQRMPIHEGWMIDGDHVIGVNPIMYGADHISVYGLRVSSESQV